MELIEYLYTHPFSIFVLVMSVLIIVITFAAPIYKKVKHVLKTVIEIRDWVHEREEADRKLMINVLQLKIMNDNIPITERLQAGDEYIKLGGNGAIKKHVKILGEEYEKMIQNNK